MGDNYLNGAPQSGLKRTYLDLKNVGRDQQLMAGDLSQIKESSRTMLNEEVEEIGAVDHSDDEFAAQGVSMSSAT